MYQRAFDRAKTKWHSPLCFAVRPSFLCPIDELTRQQNVRYKSHIRVPFDNVCKTVASVIHPGISECFLGSTLPFCSTPWRFFASYSAETRESSNASTTAVFTR